MWINRFRLKFNALCQDASYRRLAFALGLSLLLHLFLIGKFSFNLPNLSEKRDVIEARLMLPKVIPPSIENPPAVEKPATKPIAPIKPRPSNKPKSVEAVESPDLQEAPPANQPIIEHAPLEPAPIESEPIEPLIEQAELEPPMVENQAEETDRMVTSKPYQYIASEFDVYTDKDETPDRSVAGRARVVYQRLPNSERYQIKSLIQAKGLASLVIPDLLQTSDGYLDGIGLQPMHYLYKFGDKKDKTFSADFDWESKKLNLRSEKGNQTFDLQAGTQDLLSFMYQFMFVPPLQNMQLNITNGKKLGVYDYTFDGEETLTTKLGDIKTMHISRMAQEGEKKTELWLALDYKHVPVKIRETNGEGKVYELVITSLEARQEPLPLP